MRRNFVLCRQRSSGGRYMVHTDALCWHRSIILTHIRRKKCAGNGVRCRHLVASYYTTSYAVIICAWRLLTLCWCKLLQVIHASRYAMFSGRRKNRSSHKNRMNLFVTETSVVGCSHTQSASCMCAGYCLRPTESNCCGTYHPTISALSASLAWP